MSLRCHQVATPHPIITTPTVDQLHLLHHNSPKFSGNIKANIAIRHLRSMCHRSQAFSSMVEAIKVINLMRMVRLFLLPSFTVPKSQATYIRSSKSVRVIVIQQFALSIPKSE